MSHVHILKVIAGVRTAACTDLLLRELGVRSLEQLWCNARPDSGTIWRHSPAVICIIWLLY
jgi:hypothetical protein